MSGTSSRSERSTNQRSYDYSEISKIYRPGHTDYTYDEKYGFRDYRGGGRSSGRETTARVAAGAVARKILKSLDIKITGYTSSIGPIVINKDNFDEEEISIDLKAANPKDWHKYESIVFASGVYAGKISGFKKFIKMLGNHKPKQLLIVAVGASPTTELVRDKLIKDNLINDYLIKFESDKSAFFYIQGGFDPDKLFDKVAKRMM